MRKYGILTYLSPAPIIPLLLTSALVWFICYERQTYPDSSRSPKGQRLQSGPLGAVRSVFWALTNVWRQAAGLTEPHRTAPLPPNPLCAALAPPQPLAPVRSFH